MLRLWLDAAVSAIHGVASPLSPSMSQSGADGLTDGHTGVHTVHTDDGENNSADDDLARIPHVLRDFKITMSRGQLSGLIGRSTVDALFAFAGESHTMV